MRGFLIFLGLLLVLGGGAVAAAQFAPVDLSMLDSVAGAKEFLASQMALYAGGGAAGFGLLLIIIGAVSGGKKKEKPARAAKPVKAEKAPAAEKPADPKPAAGRPQPAPQPAPAPKPQSAPKTQPAPAAARPAPAPQPAAARPAAAPAAPKPTASAQPPASASAAPQDPRLLNRKRVSDLVTINDALKAYHAKHGAYPKADALAGFPERGAAWIKGLTPDFIPELPRDPAMSSDKAGPQYVYVSNGTDYKLLAQGVSLNGGTNVEVLGVRIDPTRQPTAENASFGFWTAGFASA